MSAPNLVISVEPTENGSVVFLPLALAKPRDAPMGQLSLRIQITNNESAGVKLTAIAHQLSRHCRRGTHARSRYRPACGRDARLVQRRRHEPEGD